MAMPRLRLVVIFQPFYQLPMLAHLEGRHFFLAEYLLENFASASGSAPKLWRALVKAGAT